MGEATDLRHLFGALYAEQQAIAIYEAQVFWRSRSDELIFREILAEERLHSLSIEPFVKLNFASFLIRPFNILFGWLFGTLLSMLPRKLCYRIHVWAEKDAAKTYEDAARKTSKDEAPALYDALTHAARQEYQHAERFQKKLLDSNVK
jgi:rubrerythrin